MTIKTNAAPSQKPATQPDVEIEHTNLSYRYGSIGIQAVAAAARYSNVRKPSQSEIANRIDLRFVEAAV